MSERTFQQRKTRILLCLLLVVVLNAIFDVLVGLPHDDLHFAIFATTGLAAFFAFAWVRVDAEEAQQKLQAWGVAVALLTKFVLPVYFIVTRGWSRGLLACLQTLLLLITLLISYSLAARATVHLMTMV